MNTPLRVPAAVLLASCLGFAGCAGGGRSSSGPVSAEALGSELAPGAIVNVDSAATGVPFAIYRGSFASGDSITLEKVVATTPRWGPGDTLTVSGHYQLASQPTATLALYVTTRNSGRTVSDPKQVMRVAAGTGAFELTCVMPEGGGEPHVSYYPSAGGSVMGGVYFRSTAR